MSAALLGASTIPSTTSPVGPTERYQNRIIDRVRYIFAAALFAHCSALAGRGRAELGLLRLRLRGVNADAPINAGGIVRIGLQRDEHLVRKRVRSDRVRIDSGRDILDELESLGIDNAEHRSAWHC